MLTRTHVVDPGCPLDSSFREPLSCASSQLECMNAVMLVSGYKRGFLGLIGWTLLQYFHVYDVQVLTYAHNLLHGFVMRTETAH